MHTHHTMHEMVLAPGPRTQVPAIVYGPSTLPTRPKFKVVNQLLSIPWLGWEAPPMEGWGGQTGNLQVYRYVCNTYVAICTYVCTFSHL